MSGGDVMDALAGLAQGSALAALRRQRPEVVARVQASDDAVFAPADDGGLRRAERAALALHIAALLRDAALERHYRARLEELCGPDANTPGDGDGRWRAMRAHAERVTLDPAGARREHVAALFAVGLSPRAVVALSQLIAYVNFQARLLAGLNMLKAER